MYEVESAQQESLAGGVHIGEGGHHNEFDVGLEFARGAQQLDAAHVRHLNVRDHHVGSLLAQEGHRLAPVLSHPHGMSVALEKMRQELTHAEFVIDDEKVRH